MDLKELENFIVIAESGNITKASKILHLSQPALSRQLQDLEKELGVQLAKRGSRELSLTEDGTYLLQRAREILAMVTKTKSDLNNNQAVSGDIYIGCGETQAMHIVAKAIKFLHARHPDVRVHIFSGGGDELRFKMKSGFLDFALIIDPTHMASYNLIPLPVDDNWGIWMHPLNPLAEKKIITLNDVKKVPAIFPRQKYNFGQIENWLGHPIESDQIIGTYNLLFNAAVMVQENISMVYCLDRLINIVNVADLVYRPLSPRLETKINLVWQKDRILSSAAAAFLETFESINTKKAPSAFTNR